jgi:cytidylate kinase
MPTDATSPSEEAADPAGFDAPTEVVAIDGPSGAGKSTVARLLANELGARYLDTGAMYRAVTLHLLRRGFLDRPGGLTDADSLANELRGVDLRIEGGRLLLDGADVGVDLRSAAVEARVSHVAAAPTVRARLRDLQREIARSGLVVAEGRDVGSVVFPRARHKFFLDADPAERARRRHGDFAAAGRDVPAAQVRDELERRDGLDRGRETAPLVQVADAVYIDSTGKSPAEIVAAMRDAVVAGDASRGSQPTRAEARVRPRLREVVRWMARVAASVWLRPRRFGTERVPMSGGVLVVANHGSHLDPIVMSAWLPRHLAFLARSTLRKIPFMGWLMEALGTLFVEREGSARAGLSVGAEALRDGAALLVFPEGTRTRDGRIGEFKRGILVMLKRVPVPVVPVGLRGLRRAMPRGSVFPRPYRCEIHVGAPMPAAAVLAPGGLEELRRRVAELAGAELASDSQPSPRSGDVAQRSSRSVASPDGRVPPAGRFDIVDGSRSDVPTPPAVTLRPVQRAERAAAFPVRM